MGIALGRLRLSLTVRAVVILIIVATHGFELKHLGWIYNPYVHHSFELGVALARISQPSDLVVMELLPNFGDGLRDQAAAVWD